MRRIYQRRLKTLFCLLVVIVVIACKDDADNPITEIRIGREAPITNVYINKQTTRNILLGGGDGKYKAYVADPTIAKVEVSGDTLKLTGVWEGNTFVTVHSHDYTARLDVNVVVPTLHFSQDSIRLYPKNNSAYVTLTGGGIVRLEKQDPDRVVDVKWNAETHIVELYPRYEGDAWLTAIGQDGTRQTLRIKVQCEGKIEKIGYYSTTSKTLYAELNTRMVVSRRQIGVSLLGGTNPKTAKGIRLSAVYNPEVGQNVEVQAKLLGTWDYEKIQTGTVRLLVEEVRADGTVLLRGPGYKFLVPYFRLSDS